MLEITDLQFGYSTQPLFDKVSLYQKPGEVLALVGPSGSGKSTLFNLLTGRVRKGYEGVISINGLSPPKATHLLTYMTQQDLLLPWRTVLENLLLLVELKEGSLFKGIKHFEKENNALYVRAKELIEEVGLAGFEEYFPHQLSGGMKQRVCLARSLFQLRPLLLLDEPFGSLDRKRRQEMYLLLHRVKQKYKLTIFFITHDVYDLAELADRVYFLDEGKIKEIAPTTDMKVHVC